MTKSFFTLPVLAALFLFSCSNDDILQQSNCWVEPSINVLADNMSDGSRSIIENFLPDGARIGVTYLTSETEDVFNGYDNIKYTAENAGATQTWGCDATLKVGNTECDVYAYYPYVPETDLTAVPISLSSRTDYLCTAYPASGISNHNPTANLTMRHVLSYLKVVVKMTNLPGDCLVSNLTLDAPFKSTASLNVYTGTLDGFDAGAPLVFTDTKTIGTDGAVYESFVIPDGTVHAIRGFVTVDGVDFAIPTTNVTFTSGCIYTLTLTLNSVQNSIMNVEIEPWTYESMSPQTDYVTPNIIITGDTDNIAIDCQTQGNNAIITAVPILSVYSVKNVTMTTDGSATMSQESNSVTGKLTVYLNNINAPTTLTFAGTSLVGNVITATYNVPATRSANSVRLLSDNPSFDLASVNKMYIDGVLTPLSTTAELESGTHTVMYSLSVGAIPDYMFAGVTALTSFTLTNNIKVFGNYAFSGCTGIKKIDIPSTVNAFGDYVFSGCTGVTEKLTIPAKVTSLGTGAFSGCTSIPDADVLCTALNERLFEGCTGLMDINLANGTTKMPSYIFSGCTGLAEIVIPGTVTEIGDYAFNGCTSLTSINLPKAIETIGNYAFGTCSNLNEIVCARLTAPVISSTSYWGVSSTGVLSFSAGATGYDSWISETEGYLNPDGWILNEMTSYYTVDLNGQWRESSVANPDATLYDGVYESNSNYNVNNGYAYMYIKVFGYETFTIYIRSYAESSFDYVMASTLDSDITGSTSYSNTTLVAGHTRSKQNSSTAISGYQKITYTLPDKATEYTIKIVYRKDGSSHSGTDRGYLLIEKQ